MNKTPYWCNVCGCPVVRGKFDVTFVHIEVTTPKHFDVDIFLGKGLSREMRRTQRMERKSRR